MKTTLRRFTNLFISSVAVLAMLFPSFQLSPVLAQEQDGGIQREYNAETGKVSLITGINHAPISVLGTRAPGMTPEAQSLALVQRFAPEFGLSDPTQELMLAEIDQPTVDRVVSKYQQMVQGVPVMAGEIFVNASKAGELYSINGEVSPGLSLDTNPKLTVEAAFRIAQQGMVKWYGDSTEDYTSAQSALWIFDESLLRPSIRPANLVWRIEMISVGQGAPIRELVLVDAKTGNISLHFNQVDTAWSTTESGEVNVGQDSNSTMSVLINVAGKDNFSSTFAMTLSVPLVNTYTAGGTSSIPGTFLCNQAQPNCTNGTNPHADAAHKYAIGTYNFYATKHLRDSINNGGMTITSTVHYCGAAPCPYANAFWNGNQMVYGDAYGFPLADDVVAHELTHGVTQYESNLFYFYQSGAINESLSDVWGEYYDQTNGLGTDTPAVNWLMGEDVSGSTPIRSMSNPPTYGDPDKMTSANYNISDLDNGGVHTNSGINNKAVFLMVDGGAFNGKTVSALGWDKTAAIYYEAQTNLLSSGADYSDLYYALQQACTNKTGQLGITSSDCQQVKNALDAVEMNSQPVANFNPDAPLCAAGMSATPIFQDNMESGTGKWAMTGHWSLQNGYASSPVNMLYGDDSFSSAESSTAIATGVALPVSSNMYLHFKHAFAFEFDGGGNYDGGVLEYSTNNGATWVDASPLFVDGRGYTGTILNYTGTTNTLKGRTAFVGDSHGYVSSRYNLSSLGGQTVKFRWRFATDNTLSYLGWMVDDVQIHTCAPSLAPTVSSSVRANPDSSGATNVGFTVTFSQSVTGVDTGDFSIATSGVSGAAVSGVSGSGSVYTVTVNTGSGSGTIHLNVVDNDSILNVSSTPLGGAGPGNGDFTTGETYTITKTWIFGDVPNTYWANSFIERLYNAGVTGGCSTIPLNYCPESTVTRAQMAVFLLKGMHGSSYSPPPVGASTGFADVATDYWAAAWIKQLFAEGITSGCSTLPLSYCPEATVTRSQMSVFLLKAKHGISYSPPPATGVFTDVPVDYWAAGFIEQLAAEGITSGCGAGVYCPEDLATRAQMAIFLVKTFNLP